ncbi:MAG: hypothetical protein LUF92_18030 [Clostridiales bacterium]|nr:hypothetical protein [Clostridiales bacterium]
MKKSYKDRGKEQQNTSMKTLSLGFFNLTRGIGMAYVILGHSMSLFLQNGEISRNIQVCFLAQDGF